MGLALTLGASLHGHIHGFSAIVSGSYLAGVVDFDEFAQSTDYEKRLAIRKF